MLHGHILVHRGPDTNYGFPAPLTLLLTAQFYDMDEQFSVSCIRYRLVKLNVIKVRD